MILWKIRGLFTCFVAFYTLSTVWSQGLDASFQSCPSNIQTETSIGQAYTLVYWNPPSILNNTESTSLDSNHEPGDRFYIGISRVIYRLSEGSEQIDICSFSVTVQDNESPYFHNCPSEITVTPTDSDAFYSDPIYWTEPTVSDNADASPRVSANYRSGVSLSRGVWEIEYIAQDFAGNKANCTFVVYVVGGAIKGCPDPVVLPTDPGLDVGTSLWVPPTVHLPGRDWSFTSSHQPGQSFSLGDTLVTYSLRDPQNVITESCTFLVEIVDYEPPVLNHCPDDIIQSVDKGRDGAIVFWDVPSVTDNVEGMVTLVSLDNPGDEFPLGVTLIEYTATDATGNEQRCSFSITIEDNEDPIFVTCPSAITVSIDKGQDTIAIVWNEPRVTDNADIPTVTSNYHSGDAFPAGHTTVTYVARDDAGNSAICEFIVTVLGYPFNEFSRIGGFLLSAHDDKKMSALDALDCLVACVEETVIVCHSVDYNAETRECRLSKSKAGIEDAKLVQNNAFNYYERLIDYTAPVITGCPRDIIRPSEPSKSYAIISWLSPTVSDSSSVKVTSTHYPGERFQIGTTDVVYTAADLRNNTQTCSFTVTIEDLEYPQLADCPRGPITQLTNGPIDADVTWTAPTATDNSNLVDVISSHNPGDLFPPGQTTVKYTASDPSGNQVFCSFEVTLKTLSESYRLLLSMVLRNFAFSDALEDRRTNQYETLSHMLDNAVNNVLESDPFYLGAITTGFRPSSGGGVIADVSIGFTQKLSEEDRRYYLNFILEVWEEDTFDVQIHEIIVKNTDGTNSTLDACLTLPCPSDMSCVASGLTCYSYCNHNPAFCMNKGACVRHEGHNLISCLCVDDNFYGRRCEQFELFNDSKVYAVIAAGIWAIILLGFIGLGLKIARQRKAKSKPSSEKTIPSSSTSIKVNHAFEFGESSTSQTTDNAYGELHDTDMTVTSESDSSKYAPSQSDSVGFHLPQESFELVALKTTETDTIVPQREARQGSQPASSVNSACVLLDEAIEIGKKDLDNATESADETLVNQDDTLIEMETQLSSSNPSSSSKDSFKNSIQNKLTSRNRRNGQTEIGSNGDAKSALLDHYSHNAKTESTSRKKSKTQGKNKLSEVPSRKNVSSDDPVNSSGTNSSISESTISSSDGNFLMKRRVSTVEIHHTDRQ